MAFQFLLLVYFLTYTCTYAYGIYLSIYHPSIYPSIHLSTYIVLKGAEEWGVEKVNVDCAGFLLGRGATGG